MVRMCGSLKLYKILFPSRSTDTNWCFFNNDNWCETVDCSKSNSLTMVETSKALFSNRNKIFNRVSLLNNLNILLVSEILSALISCHSSLKYAHDKVKDVFNQAAIKHYIDSNHNVANFHQNFAVFINN